MQPSYLLSSVIFSHLMLLQVTRVTSDNDSDNDSDQCQRQISCSDCIQLAHCVYCLDANFSREVSINKSNNIFIINDIVIMQVSRCLARSDTGTCVMVEDPVNLVISDAMLNVSLGQDSASGDFVQVIEMIMSCV